MYIAYAAGITAFVTSIPQLVQIIQTKKVRDLNPWFFILHSSSDILYVAYGFLSKDYILAYSVSLPAICNVAIFILWILYRDNDISRSITDVSDAGDSVSTDNIELNYQSSKLEIIPNDELLYTLETLKCDKNI